MRSFSRFVFATFIVQVAIVVACIPALADSAHVAYDISLTNPTDHIFHVTMRVSDLARPSSTVRMPIWIPGYYSDDQYGRNVLTFDASDANGHAIQWRRDGQSAYHLDTTGVGGFTVHYDLYANRRADIGTQLSAERALFNGAESLMYLQNDDGYPAPGPVSLAVHGPAGWQLESGLLAMRTGPDEYTAPSYDVLVDCPTILSPHLNVATFTVNDVPYHLVVEGVGNYDVNKLAPIARQIIGSEVKMMGHAGYKEYWAIFLAGGGGGMEHLNSTLSGISAFGWEKPHDSTNGAFGGSNWNYFALVLAHEHFHSWNVKRIRPVVLGPFRYDQEVHTRRLDVAEGFTEYYTYVHGLRSGFSAAPATWEQFADDIDTEENSPGRRLFSLGDLSWNTWWSSDDPYIPGGDYYDGAAVMAFMLDLKIRHDTNNVHSLDDVLRYLFADWEAKSLNQFQSTGGTYADDALPSIIEKATGDSDAASFFHTWWDTTTLPDWNTYLQYAGLKLVKTMPKSGTASLDADWAEIGAPAGVGYRPRAGKLNYGYPTLNPDVVMFTRVLPGGAADRSGLQQFDVLQNLGGLGVTQASLPSILAMHRPGDRLPATVLRDGRTVSLTVTLGQDREPSYAISPRKDATAAQTQLLKEYESGEPFGK
ncbi:MAG TPA: hypothetical protein VII69_03300 [Candidatus Eremiobacteraceae bacterium]